MADLRGSSIWSGHKRFARWILILTPVVLGGLIAAEWLPAPGGTRSYWQFGLGLLSGLEVGYLATLVTSILLFPTLCVMMIRARRRGLRRPVLARVLLVCFSFLVCAGVIEGAAAVYHQQATKAGARPDRGRLEERKKKNADGPLRIPPPEAITLPTQFPEAGEDGSLHLVMVGESSAQGVPYNFWVSIGAMVGWEIEKAIPNRRVQVDVLANSGETLEIQHGKLAGLRRRPDLLIVYCGHNEFSARMPATRDLDYYLDGKQPTTWQKLMAFVERFSPLCGMIQEGKNRCRVAIPPPPGGNRALVDAPAYTASEYDAILTDFRHRLETIVAWTKQVGAVPILIVPPASDSGFEPNRSFLPSRTTRAERQAFESDFTAARQREATDPAGSMTRYKALLQRDPDFAEAHYRLARLLEQAGEFDDAYRHDMAARDRDGFPMRCPIAFQDAYRDVAVREGTILIDGQAYFHAIAPHGLLDDHLFHDGIHPSLRGQIALAQAILGALHATHAFGWTQGSPQPHLDPAGIAAHFGLGSYQWWKVCLWGIMFYDLTSPAHYDESTRRVKQARFGKASDKIKAGMAPEQVGLPNIGVPEPVPIVPDAFRLPTVVQTAP